MPCAIVTGASRGIGRGISLLLAEKGYKIVAVGTRSAEDVAEYVGELTARSPESIYVSADISTPDGRARILESAAQTGGFDILVNNAGIAPKVRADLLEMTEESLDRLINTNLKGTFLLSQAAAKQLIERETDAHKMIINITSISAENVERKSRRILHLEGRTVDGHKAVRRPSRRVRNQRLRAAPGHHRTDMTAVVKDKYTAMINGGLLPIKRMGQPSDIAKAVYALAEGYFAYTTGSVMNIDGGFTLSRL